MRHGEQPGVSNRARPLGGQALAALDPKSRVRIAAKIDSLSLDLRPQGVEKLEGSDDQYRVRVGSYRIIYSIADKRLIVLVLRIGHRRESTAAVD